MRAKARFDFRGSRLTLDQLEENDDFRSAERSALAAGFDPEGRDLVHAFQSEEDFSRWAQQTRYGDFVSFAQSSMERVKQRGEKDRDRLVTRHKRERDRITAEIERLGEETRREWPSEELFVLARQVGILGTVVMCEHVGWSGRWEPFISLLPDFGWINFNDMMSSYFVFGLAVFYEHIWFGGRALWTAGIPVWGQQDLGSWGWNDMASSGWKL